MCIVHTQPAYTFKLFLDPSLYYPLFSGVMGRRWLLISALTTGLTGATYWLLRHSRAPLGQPFLCLISFLKRRTFVEVNHPKLGLAFRYSASTCVLRGEIRMAPVRVFEFYLTHHETSRILITVEQCGAPLSLQEYKTHSLNAITAQLGNIAVEHEKTTVSLGGQPAIEFEYTHISSQGTPRKVWCILATLGHRAYSVHFNSHGNVYDKGLTYAQEMARSMSISHVSTSESFQYFTSASHGLGMRVATEYSLDDTAAEEDTLLARFVTTRAPVSSVQLIEQSFIEVRCHRESFVGSDDSSMWNHYSSMLRTHVEHSLSSSENLEWVTHGPEITVEYLCDRVTHKKLQPTFAIHTLVTEKTHIPVQYFFYDILSTNHVEDNEDTQPIKVSHVTFFAVRGNECMSLTAWGLREHFSYVWNDALACIHSLTFTHLFSLQSCMLSYCNPTYQFGLRIPSQLQIVESVIGDPLLSLLFREKSDEAGWRGRSLESSGFAESSANSSFAMHIRVQDLFPTYAQLHETASQFINELRQTEGVEIESEKPTALHGHMAHEVLYIQDDGEGQVHKNWAILAIYCGRQYILHVVGTSTRFRWWKKMCRSVIHGFHFYNCELY